MSAEPARPGPDPDAGPATVLLFRSKTPARNEHSNETVRDTADATDDSPHQRIANSAEQLFLKHGRTLTDDDTKEAFLITLKLVTGLHAGAHATGVIDDQQHQELLDTIEALKSAPTLLG